MKQKVSFSLTLSRILAMGLLVWLCPLETYDSFFFSDKVKNKPCELLHWIIHCLIISLTSNLSSNYPVYKSMTNTSVISSYSVHPARDYSVPFAIASPVVTWQFAIIVEPFLKTLSHCWSRTFILHSWMSCFLVVCIKTRGSFAAVHLPLSRSFPVSNLSCFLFIMFQFYESSPNSISKDCEFSFRSSAMFQSSGRWTALSSLSPEIHILRTCHLYPFEVCQMDFNHSFHLSNNTHPKPNNLCSLSSQYTAVPWCSHVRKRWLQSFCNYCIAGLSGLLGDLQKTYGPLNI